MNDSQVAKRNEESTESYLKDIHRLAQYIESRQDELAEHKGDYVKALLEQDALAQGGPRGVNYHMLAASAWVVLFNDDETREELDAKYGEGFCDYVGRFAKFDPRSNDAYLDRSFVLPAGDYVITDPTFLGEQGGEASDTAVTAGLPSARICDTFEGACRCMLFRMDADSTFDSMTKAGRRGAACGCFKSESGRICVASLKDIEAFDGEFASKIERNAEDTSLSEEHAAIVRNFKGTCRFEVVETFYKSSRKTLHAGFTLHVVLEGTDTYTELPVRYESRPIDPGSEHLFLG